VPTSVVSALDLERSDALVLGLPDQNPLAVVDVMHSFEPSIDRPKGVPPLAESTERMVAASANCAPPRMQLHPATEEVLILLSGVVDECPEEDLVEQDKSEKWTNVAVQCFCDADAAGVLSVELVAKKVPVRQVSDNSVLSIELRLVHSDSPFFLQALEGPSGGNHDGEYEACTGPYGQYHRAMRTIRNCFDRRLVMMGSFLVIVLPPQWSDNSQTWDLTSDPCSSLEGENEIVAVFAIDCITETINNENDGSRDVAVDRRWCYRLQDAKFSLRLSLDQTALEGMRRDELPIGTINELKSVNESCPGYEDLVDELMRLSHVQHPSGAPSAVLLTGCVGVGKTKLASCITAKLEASDAFHSDVCYVSAKDIVLAAAAYVDLDDLINFILSPKDSGTVGCLILDDLDSVIDAAEGSEGSGHQDMERVLAINAVVGAIDSLVEKYDKEGSKVSGPRPFILGICCADIGNLPKEFVRVGRFEKLVTMDAPTQSQRELILKHMLQDLPLADVSNKETKGDFDRVEMAARWAEALAQQTAGCVASDIRRICADGLTRAHSRLLYSQDKDLMSISGLEKTRVIWDDIREAARICVPSQLAHLDVTISKFLCENVGSGRLDYKALHQEAWTKFGGYAEVKDRVYRTVVSPWSRDSANDVNDGSGDSKIMLRIPPPSGVLFYGPPGTGKTMASQYLASSLALPMVKVKASDVLDQWLGGSEAAIRSLFARARSAAPCILLFDEIDALASNRSDEGDSTNVHSRILSTLLNEMDGVSSSSGRGGVLVVATTNRLHAIDAALLRPGRLEEHIELRKPAVADIKAIFALRLAKASCASNVDTNALAVQLQERGASGADVEGICTAACLHAIRVASNNSVGKDGETKISLTMNDFAEALTKVFL